MKRKLINIALVTTLVSINLVRPALADENKDIVNSTNVVVLVDFSGSITEDPRYPEAEKKALENLVNVDWPIGSKIAILAFGAADSRSGGKPSTFAMCPDEENTLRSVKGIEIDWRM